MVRNVVTPAVISLLMSWFVTLSHLRFSESKVESSKHQVQPTCFPRVKGRQGCLPLNAGSYAL